MDIVAATMLLGPEPTKERVEPATLYTRTMEIHRSTRLTLMLLLRT